MIKVNYDNCGPRVGHVSLSAIRAIYRNDTNAFIYWGDGEESRFTVTHAEADRIEEEISKWNSLFVHEQDKWKAEAWRSAQECAAKDKLIIELEMKHNAAYAELRQELEVVRETLEAERRNHKQFIAAEKDALRQERDAISADYAELARQYEREVVEKTEERDKARHESSENRALYVNMLHQYRSQAATLRQATLEREDLAAAIEHVKAESYKNGYTGTNWQLTLHALDTKKVLADRDSEKHKAGAVAGAKAVLTMIDALHARAVQKVIEGKSISEQFSRLSAIDRADALELALTEARKTVERIENGEIKV